MLVEPLELVLPLTLVLAMLVVAPTKIVPEKLLPETDSPVIVGLANVTLNVLLPEMLRLEMVPVKSHPPPPDPASAELLPMMLESTRLPRNRRLSPLLPEITHSSSSAPLPVIKYPSAKVLSAILSLVISPP